MTLPGRCERRWRAMDRAGSRWCWAHPPPASVPPKTPTVAWPWANPSPRVRPPAACTACTPWCTSCERCSGWPVWPRRSRRLAPPARRPSAPPSACCVWTWPTPWWSAAPTRCAAVCCSVFTRCSWSHPSPADPSTGAARASTSVRRPASRCSSVARVACNCLAGANRVTPTTCRRPIHRDWAPNRPWTRP